MKATIVVFCVLFSSVAVRAQTWQAKVDAQLPLLGHRNWILIVDSAYPLQVSPGIETVETNADQLVVLQQVLQRLSSTRHVRANVFEDQELAFVPESDAPGVTRYRTQLKEMLASQPLQILPHEQIISRIDEAGKTFRILVLKTTMTIPYTSVFLQLDCRYWSAAQEKNLRTSMNRSR